MTGHPHPNQNDTALSADLNSQCECLLGTIPGVVYFLDEKGNFTFISDSLEASMGYSHKELVGKHFSKLIHPGDVHSVSRDHILPHFKGVPTGNDRAPKLFDERRSWPRRTDGLQVRIRPREGFRENEELILRCRVNASGKYGADKRFQGTLGVMYDVSEDGTLSFSLQKRRQYNVFELLTQALAHVFSNVFTGIYGNLQLIEMQLENPDEFKGNIEAIKFSVENAVSLIRKLAQTVALPEPKKGHTLLNIMDETGSELLGKAGISYNCDTGPGLWLPESDPDHLRHILRSVYFHVARSVADDGAIIIHASNVGEASIKFPRIDCGYIMISFEFSPLPDTGSTTKIDQFSSLERIASMALSYELLKKVGGSINVENGGKKSVVNLFLPALKS